MSLKGKIVFVTGASSGIGAATALAFAAEGARLLLAARRSDKLADIAVRASAGGAEAVHTILLDVRDRSAVETAIAALPDEWAAIDAHQIKPGMSELQTRMAIGMKMHVDGETEGDRTVDYDVNGKHYAVTFVKNHATAIKSA